MTNLSVSTVSRALKDHPDISKATKDKVHQVAEALNYSPNLTAQLLRTNSSKLVSLIFPVANTFFFPALLEGINEVIAQNGFTLTFLQSDSSIEKEKELVEFCLGRAVDGVLISLASNVKDVSHLLPFKKANIPVVLIDSIWQNDHFASMTIDDKATASEATEHLIQKGHKNILGLFHDPRLLMTKLRKEGFVQALEKHKIPWSEKQILTVETDGDIDADIIELFENNPEATAIFTMTDSIMVKGYQVIKNLGFNIPEDISIIAISDGKAPYYFYPNITHMLHSGKEVGIKAAQLLFDVIKEKKNTDRFYKIDTKLIDLDSVKTII